MPTTADCNRSYDELRNRFCRVETEDDNGDDGEAEPGVFGDNGVRCDVLSSLESRWSSASGDNERSGVSASSLIEFGGQSNSMVGNAEELGNGINVPAVDRSPKATKAGSRFGVSRPVARGNSKFSRSGSLASSSMDDSPASSEYDAAGATGRGQ